MNPASIPVTRTNQSRLAEIDFNRLEFGKNISDHMLLCAWRNGKWHMPEIVPYGPISFTPAMLALHYGQAVFEGMKAFRMKDGSINLFRPYKHAERFNQSLKRMAMPVLDEDFFVSCLHALVDVDRAWVPREEGSSLYIRPVAFATEERLGLKVSEEYLFAILTGPVGPYFNKPIRVKVEDHYVRAAEGGTGYAKCAGNYGGAFYPTQLAREAGYDQVLWTDAREHKFIDESGAMNVMFVINGKLITPQLTTAILDGVTRDSILTLAREEGISVEERKISVEELAEAFKHGTITEAFGVGTAAVVAPIAVVSVHGRDYALPPLQTGSVQERLKSKLHAIRLGYEPDRHGWNYIIK
ncbi:MAG: branched-chain amino acid aminotransferase [Cyclobacteriaceae bacterium]|nr:branched-chain amino acid aminotransferase [Cyclobacteriaceae bacterium]